MGEEVTEKKAYQTMTNILVRKQSDRILAGMLISASAAAAAAAVAARNLLWDEDSRRQEKDESKKHRFLHGSNNSTITRALWFAKVRCEEGVGSASITTNSSSNNNSDRSAAPSRPSPPAATTSTTTTATTATTTTISWVHWWLAKMQLVQLPIPRVIQRHDPDLTLSMGQIRKRQRDEHAVRDLQMQIQHIILQQQQQQQQKLPQQQPHPSSTTMDSSRERVSELVKQVYEILYGPGVTPQDRENFLQQYGCTGWTEQVLIELLELGADRGFVEMGAGHGQWSRILTDRYYQSIYFDHAQRQQPSPNTNQKQFDFCLAYDNMSDLPLNTNIYHVKTQPYRDYFYPKVQKCESIRTTLQQWQCRGRVLLLVYPPPPSSSSSSSSRKASSIHDQHNHNNDGEDLALEAIRSYTDISPYNDTIVYVGEGRYGANASEAFFDFLEQNGQWILYKVLPVKSFGSKGYERLYILKRTTNQQLGQQ